MGGELGGHGAGDGLGGAGDGPGRVGDIPGGVEGALGEGDIGLD